MVGGIQNVDSGNELGIVYDLEVEMTKLYTYSDQAGVKKFNQSVL